jgi:hypothetical protein
MLLRQVNVDSLLKPPPDGRVKNPWYVGGSQHQNTVHIIANTLHMISIIMRSIVNSILQTCICTRNSVLILLADSDSLSDLLLVRESISSMKMMLGFCSLAISNRFFTNFSLSPSHLDTRSLLDTEKKVELFASVATALAR